MNLHKEGKAEEFDIFTFWAMVAFFKFREARARRTPDDRTHVIKPYAMWEGYMTI